LNIVIEEQTDNPIKISSKSWDNIIRLIPEEKKYSLAYICFSLVNEIEEDEIWGIKKNGEGGEEEVLQDVFFNTVLEASTPHEVPFVMCEDDFSQFTDYFNQKEKEEENRKIKLTGDLAKGEDKVEKKKELPTKEDKEGEKKEEEPEVEVKTQVIEDKNGVTRMVTTKTKTSHVTVYEPKIIQDSNKDMGKKKDKEKTPLVSKDKKEPTTISSSTTAPLRSKGKKVEQKQPKTDVVKPSKEVVKETIKYGQVPEPQTELSRKIIITKDGEEQVFEEEEIPTEDIIYRVIIEGTKRNPLTKIVRKRKMLKGNK